MKDQNIKEQRYNAMLRKIYISFAVILPLSLVAGFFIEPHGHFIVDNWPFFYAFYGLTSCVVIVLFSKFIGFFLKRPESYYDK